MPSEQGMPPSNNLQSPTNNSWRCDYCGVAVFRSYEEAVMHEDGCRERASADAAARKRRRPGSSPQSHGGYAPIPEDRHELHPHRQPKDEFHSPTPIHRPLSHIDPNSMTTPSHAYPHQHFYGAQPSPHYHRAEPSPMVPSHHQMRSSPSPSPPDSSGGQHARAWDGAGGETGGNGPPAPSPPPTATPGSIATTPQHYMPLMMSHTPLARSSVSVAPRHPPMVLLPLTEAHRYRSARDLAERDSVSCQNVEIFRATAEDVADHSNASPERRGEVDGKSNIDGSLVVVGQVGLRCIHCSRSPLASAVYSAVFPGSIGMMGASLRMMAQRHFPACGMTPTDVREVMLRASEEETDRRRRKQREKGVGRRGQQRDGEDDDDESASGEKEALLSFCVEFCRKENIVNRFPAKTGLVFGTSSAEELHPNASPVASKMKRKAISSGFNHPSPSPLRHHAPMGESSMVVQPTPLASKKRQQVDRPSIEVVKFDKESTISQPSPSFSSGDPSGQSQSGGVNAQAPVSMESGVPPYQGQSPSHSMYGQGGPPPQNLVGSPPGDMDPTLAGAPGGPPHPQQGPPPPYDPSPSSPNFPFYQDGYGAWLCRYCVSVPPFYKAPNFVWNHPSQSPPSLGFIEQHLRACQGYNQPQPHPSHHPGAGPPMHPQQGPMYGPPHQQHPPPHQYPPHPHGPHPGQPPPNYPPGQQPPPPGPHGAHPHHPPPGAWGTPPGSGPPPPQGMVQHLQGQPPPHGGHPSPHYPPPQDQPQHGGNGGPPPYPPYPRPHPPPHGMPHQSHLMPIQGPGSPHGQGGSPSRQGGQHQMYPEGSDAAMQSAIDYLTDAEREYKAGLSSSGTPSEAWADLVLSEDKLLLTDYFFHLMKQLRLCRFSESDRKTRGGKRENIAIGYGGLQCIHCSDTPNSRKFFWSNVDRLANSFAEIPGHILKCRRCPSQTKAAITELKRRHPDQMARLPRGSQKVFFRRMWRRLHDGDAEAGAASTTGTLASVPSSSSPTAHSKSGVKEEDSETVSSSAEGGVPHTPSASRATTSAASQASEVTSASVSTPVKSSSSREVSGVLSANTTDGAARALAASASGVPPPEPVLLAIDEDKEWLSDMDCFVRLNVEAFCATEEDVATAASDRKYPIVRGQVGIRCIHCASKDGGEGARGTAVSFPYSISGIYESVREFQRVHLESCGNLPAEVRDKYTSLKGSSSLSSVLRRYYVLAAKALGMYDTADGIRAGGETVPVDASGYDFSAAAGAKSAVKQEATPINAGSGSNLPSGVSPFEAGGPSVTPLESRKRKSSSPAPDEASAKKCSLDLNREI